VSVASKLFERACGYVHGAVKFYRGEDGGVIKVPYEVHHPPDTQAASLWLRNRQPDRWRAKHEIDVAEAGESLVDDMTEDQPVELLMLRRGTAHRKPG
jgi:hypothetical protein